MIDEIDKTIDNIIVSLKDNRGIAIQSNDVDEIQNIVEEINEKFKEDNDYKVIELDLNQIDSLDKFIKKILDEAEYPLFSQDFEDLGYDLYEAYDGNVIIILKNFTLKNAKRMSFNFTSQIRGWYDRGYANFVIFSNEDLYEIETSLTIAGSLLATTFQIL